MVTKKNEMDSTIPFQIKTNGWYNFSATLQSLKNYDGSHILILHLNDTLLVSHSYFYRLIFQSELNYESVG